ncbi:MAG: hypothetical protein ABI284_06430 [Nitrosospira sp.]
MKLFSTSSLLAVASMAILSIAGVAQAQYGGSKPGPESSAGQSGPAGSSPADNSGASGQGGDGMGTGYVDQEKRVERGKDKDSNVPDFPMDKDGKPKKDPRYEQGGSIGPN